jgi:hypothetical protein
MKTNTVARAARDIATGRKALGRFNMISGFTLPPPAVEAWEGTKVTIEYSVATSRRKSLTLSGADVTSPTTEC